MNINSIFKRKHKYLVTFYKPSRVRKIHMYKDYWERITICSQEVL